MNELRGAAEVPPKSQRRPNPLRLSLARWCQASALVLLVGCGTSFELGDEAWIELPGLAAMNGEYAVVEVVSLADGRARVELIERLPVSEDGRPRLDTKTSSARRLLRRLDDGKAAWVAEEELIAPEVGELDIEAKRHALEILMSDSWLGRPSSFLAVMDGFDATEVEEALGMAERRGLDDVARSMEILLALIEGHAGIEEDELEERMSALRDSADMLRDLLAEGPEHRNTLDAYEEANDIGDQAALMNAMTSFESTATILALRSIVEGTVVGPSIVGNGRTRLARLLSEHLSMGDSAEDAAGAVSAVSEAMESVANLLTQDGKRKFRRLAQRELLAQGRSALALALARQAIEAAATEVSESDPTDSTQTAREVFDRAREIAEPLADELDFEPVWWTVEAEFLQSMASSSESEIRAALDEGDLEQAAAQLNDFLQVSETLGSLYARHDKPKLTGANAEEHAKQAGRRLLEGVERQFAQAAATFLGSESADLVPGELAEREALLREIVAPFNAVLGREALDDSFFHEAHETARANAQRNLLRVGQVWTGAVLCGEASDYRRYRAGSNSRGARYHGPERLALSLELVEAQEQGARLLFQGILTAQNLPSNAGWRHRDPDSGDWKNTARPSSTQFVRLAYQPRLLTVELRYGVLDHASHVERYGESRYYVGNVEGSWQQFRGQGTMTPSPPLIKGRISQRYIDDTCTEFSLSPSRSTDSATESGPAHDPTPLNEPDATPGAGSDEAGGLPSLSNLTEQTYLGGMKSRGMKLFALSADGDWCAGNVVFKIEAESGEVFSDGTLEFYMRQFGQRINEEDFCPAARTATLVGYAGANPEPCFSGEAAASEWRVVGNSSASQCD